MATHAAAGEVANVIQRRLQNGAALLARSLPLARLKDVAGTADFTQMLVAILHHLPAVDPEERRAAERLARTAAFKREMIERAGGALTAEEVRTLLGYKSVQAVHKAVANRRLLVVDDNGRKLFPAFQFDGAGIAPGIGPVLEASPTTRGWAMLQFLVDGDEGLGDEDPMDMVKGDPDTIARLARFAATLTD